MPVSSSTEHWIKSDALTINLNHFGDPDYLQVSVLAGAVVMAFKQDVIGYNAAHNYRTWPLEAANTYLETSSSVNVYAKLTRSEVNARALVIYDPVLRDIEGREITYVEVKPEELDSFGNLIEGGEIIVNEKGEKYKEELGEVDSEFFYLYLGEISSSLDMSGRGVLREWIIDFKFGSLDTNQYQNEEGGGEWKKLFHWNKVSDLIEVLKTFSSAIFKTLSIGEKLITNVKRTVDSDNEFILDENGDAILDEEGNPIKDPEFVPVSDETIPTTAWVEKQTDGKYLSKIQDDRSVGTVASDKGFEVGKFESGTLGTGASMYEGEDKSTYVEADFLKIRKKATFTTISVQELKHVGGEIILSPAAMICSRVEKTENGWKCYFNTEDSEGRKVYQEFSIDDLARCQTFNLSPKGANDLAGNHYYWRKVVSVGDDYIELSNSECDAQSDAPQVGDNIAQLGNTSNRKRQAAIILSAFGSDAPSYKQYNGIDGFSLVGKQVTKLSPYGNELTGVLNIEAGSTGAQNLSDLPDEIYNAVHIGSVNLLLNSGFTGDYKSEELNASYLLNSGGEVFSRGLKHWAGNAIINDDTASVSGKCAVIGSLSQSVQLMKDEGYVVSFKAKGVSVKVMLGGSSVEQVLGTDYTSYSFKFVSDGIGTFSISGDATICDLQLERGTIATDWHASPYDNDKTLAEFQTLKYIQDAIREGDTTILGGLILSSMIQLGNYKDGKMKKVNAGVSGVFNDDNDVAFWGGGTFENAIKTIVKFKENPRYRPTDSEWASLANFAVSHGGDVFLRGYVYALGGYFRGAVEIANGKIMLNDDGSGLLANGGIRWDKNGIMYRKSTDVLLWNRDLFNYEAGAYFDISTIFANSKPTIEIPTPPSDGYRICLALKENLGSGSCIIKGLFRVHDVVNDVFITANSISIYNWSSDEYWLTYNANPGFWKLESDKYSIEEGIVVLGMNGRTSVGGSVVDKNSVSTTDVYAAETITVTGRSESSITTFGGLWVVGSADIGGGLSIGGGASVNGILSCDTLYAWDNVEVFGPVTATRFKTSSNSGVTKNVNIKSTDGTHVLKFDGGIFIGSEFTANS